MVEPSSLPLPEPFHRRSFRRLRQWGGPELLRVPLLFLFGLGFGSAYAMTEPGYRLGERMLDRIRSIPAAELPSPVPAPEPAAQEPASEPEPEPPTEAPPSPYFRLFRTIFLHNLKVAMVAALGGLMTRVIPLGVTLLNGTLLGMCSVVIMIGDGLSFVDLVLFLGPHGIFELPAILLASVIGARLTRLGRSDPNPGGRWRALQRSWKELAVTVALLLLAASIEARAF
jgi:hypothetical protein